MPLKFCLRKNIGIWLTCLILTSACSATVVGWRSVAPGMEYVELKNFPEFPNGSLHAFRFDLDNFNLSLLPTRQANGAVLGLDQLAKQQGAILAVNGGFFSKDMKPLGLRISQGQALTPLRPISWWGVFLVRHDKPQIVSKKQFRQEPDISFAIQAGPRLLIDGDIPKMPSDIDYRTALCVTTTHKVVVVVTQNLMLSTSQLASILRSPSSKGGFDCVDAINLDGGHSTQLFAKTKDFELIVPSFVPIAEAVLVTAK